MINHIKKSLELGAAVEKQITTDDPQHLESVKDDLKEKMGAPVGLHTAGVPLIFSALFALLSFAIPQLSIWDTIFGWMEWPQHAVFIGIIITGLVYCLLVFPSLTLVSRGCLPALKFYLVLLLFTAVLAVLYLLCTIIMLLSGIESHMGFLIGAIIGFVFILASVKCLNSAMLVKTMAFYLHNRVWRRQLKIHHRQLTKRK
ncbi:hypothetical protein ACWA06_00980 [Serratia rhizosphaerae]|uniref:hypothetical protein n=1 Tax=Serratia sp. Tan611 TaxID=2773264 RepID=UPI0019319C08|nr:hypothetical protein [Serratia sp. Tan611]MBU3892467.1 hypothetical protein [Serratia rubidaea]CAE1146151.1 conserved membrane protein of unknown function [Serratia sp. Tan611]